MLPAATLSMQEQKYLSQKISFWLTDPTFLIQNHQKQEIFWVWPYCIFLNRSRIWINTDLVYTQAGGNATPINAESQMNVWARYTSASVGWRSYARLVQASTWLAMCTIYTVSLDLGASRKMTNGAGILCCVRRHLNIVIDSITLSVELTIRYVIYFTCWFRLDTSLD